MDEPDWAKVLNYLYKENSEIHLSTSEEHDISDEIEHPSIEDVPKKTGLSIEEARKILDKMYTMGIVKRGSGSINISGTKTRYSIYTLNKEGFNVAHDREQNKNRQQINKSIRNLTVVLAIAALIQAIATVANVASVGLKPFTVVVTGSFLLIAIGLVGVNQNWF